jgi:hypothetical protein
LGKASIFRPCPAKPFRSTVTWRAAEYPNIKPTPPPAHHYLCLETSRYRVYHFTHRYGGFLTIVMTWDEFWGDFSKAEYVAQIAHLSEDDLRREHSIIRQKLISAGSTTTLGAGAAFHTFGASLLGAGVGARRLVYNTHKLNAIEAGMNREEWPLGKLRKRDIIIGAGPSIAAAVIVPGRTSFCITCHRTLLRAI